MGEDRQHCQGMLTTDTMLSTNNFASWTSHRATRCVICQARKRSCPRTRSVICRRWTLCRQTSALCVHLYCLVAFWQAAQPKPVIASLHLFCFAPAGKQ